MKKLNDESPRNLERWYGKNCPDSPYADQFDRLLQRWHDIAVKNNILYSIAYGTLLGWRRHQSYIPYDMDVDVMIGRQEISPLFSLLKYPWCNLNRDVKFPFPDEFHMILLESHDQSARDSARQRYNCRGEKVEKKVDVCAFNGPIGRLVTSDRPPYIDIYVYHKASNQKELNALEESGDCVEPEGLYGTYINSKIASKLPPVSPCRVNGMAASSLKEPDPMLSGLYGNSFLKPDHLWMNGKWTKAH